MDNPTRSRLRLLTIILLYAIGAYMLTRAEDGGMAVAYLLAPVFSATLAAACTLDGKILGKPLVRWEQIVIVLFPYAAVIFLSTRRGWRGAGIFLLHGIGIIVLATLLAITLGTLPATA